MTVAPYVQDVGTGRPLLLLHGWSCHGGLFGPQIEAFRATNRVIVPDLPGHGRTGRHGGALTIEAAADAVAAVLADKGCENVVAVGWSMGAHVAYSMIDRHGTGRLAALVVEDMTPKVLNDDTWHLGLSDGRTAEQEVGIAQAMRTHWKDFAPRIAERIFATGLEPDRDLLAYTTEQIARADPALLAPIWESLTAQDFRTLVPEIAIPVVLAHGARSALYGPEVAQWQAERLPHGRTVSFDKSGHAPHLEEPCAFRDLLAELLDPAPVRT